MNPISAALCRRDPVAVAVGVLEAIAVVVRGTHRWTGVDAVTHLSQGDGSGQQGPRHEENTSNHSTTSLNNI